MLSPVIHDLYENTITERAKASWQRESNSREKSLGYIFFAKDKNSFEQGVALRTYYTLDRKMATVMKRMEVDKFEAPFITFNSFGVRKKCKNVLRWINAISIEIDNEEATLADIMHLCQIHDLPYPSLVIKSPKGIHCHWLIERERVFFNQSKKLEEYDLISSALKKVFKWIGADAVGAERYWRMPTSYNVLYQNDDRFIFSDLKNWAMECLQVENKHLELIGKSNRENLVPGLVFKGIMNHPAIQELLQGVPCGYKIRNYTAFTLALLLYSTQDMSKNEVYSYLSNVWNPKLKIPMKKSELTRTVASACSGRYKGPKTKWINYILEAKGSERRFKYQIRTEYVSQNKYTKRSVLVQKILEFVRNNDGIVQLSQRSLAKEIGASFKSVQLALEEIKTQNLAEIHTKQNGRAGGTIIRLIDSVDDCFIEENHNEREEDNVFVRELASIEECAATLINFEGTTNGSLAVPLPSNNPTISIKNTVAACRNRRISIDELYMYSRLNDYELFIRTLLDLIQQKVIIMGDPGRDKKALFVLGEDTFD